MAPSPIYCPRCGRANPPEVAACFGCGQPLQASTSVSGSASSSTPSQKMAAAPPLVLLKGRYHLLAQVGMGESGVVYQAEDIQLGHRLVAVKEMEGSALSQQDVSETTEAFYQEAQVLASLSHQNLPRIQDYFSQVKRRYLVMEYIQGQTLEARLQQTPDGMLPAREAFQIVLQLCRALEYLHSQTPPLLARDLQPANILLTPQGGVYLVGSGIACHAGFLCGSPGYAAPEVADGQVTPRSDMYSLGAVLHQMLTGDDPAERPYRFAQPLFPPLPPDAWALIQQMVDPDEQRRPATMTILRQRLQRLVDGGMTGQPGASSVPPVPPFDQTGMGQPPPMPLSAGTLPAAVPLGIRQPSAAFSSLPPRPPMGPGIDQMGGIAAPAGPPGAPTKSRTSRRWLLAGGVGLLLVLVLVLVLVVVSLLRPPFNSVGESALGTVYSLAWSPDGKHIASGGSDHKVRIWEVATGKTILIYTKHLSTVYTLAWSPDGKLIASAGSDGIVEVWKVSDGTTVFEYKAQQAQINAVAWSPDGSRIASAGEDKTVQVWDATTGQNGLVYRGHTDAVMTVAWSPDGKDLASGGKDQTVQVWDAATLLPMYTYQGHTRAISKVAWSPDGKQIASASYDNTVQVWDALTGMNPAKYSGHTGRVETVAWSPIGQYLASGGDDNLVQVWSILDESTKVTYHKHLNTVYTAMWSPDGSEVASGSVDGSIHVWAALTGVDALVYRGNS